MGRKSQISLVPGTQQVLTIQIQCNPYQITNGARTENFTICMKTQKTPNSHRNLEKKKMELKESGFLTSEYTTKLQ